MPLHDDIEEFRNAAHAAVDWMAGYLSASDRYPVVARVVPGETRARFDPVPPEQGAPLASLLSAFDEKILPGITHWNHPGFLAYFSITGSPAGVLGEMLAATLNVNGMLWKTSPAVTELEQVVLAWLREALGLGDSFFGIINDTASINSFLALAAAREATGLSIREQGMSGRDLPQLRVYCSEQAHSSIEKAALALGFGTTGIRKIGTDASFAMNLDELRRAVTEDRSNGVVPAAIVAAVGTTATTAVDAIDEIGLFAASENIWFHVDAAYAGSAMICPEMRALWSGIEHADSLVVNPHKWLFTPVDCSVLYTRRPDVLKETFSLVPDYLETSETEVINYMDYGLQLGRRFRALKLWLVFAHYGVAKLREVIRGHVALAQRLAEEIRRREFLELVVDPLFSLVVFRFRDERRSEELGEKLISRVNAEGDVFLAGTKLRNRHAIRVAIGHARTEWSQLQKILDAADAVQEGANGDR